MKRDSRVDIFVTFGIFNSYTWDFCRKKVGSYFREQKIIVSEMFTSIIVDTLRCLKLWWEEHSS